ncbi:hypothetical protein ACFQZZ_20575 [Nocardia sp. GCM10030253]|uniref:hypothetical protein n=1 Tax=Nocardia sp. GCM10030253 TaxID=3273404 RepID=UPI003634A8E5
MTSPNPKCDPAMEAWIAEKSKHFQPSDMGAAIGLMRGFERVDRERARLESRES